MNNMNNTLIPAAGPAPCAPLVSVVPGAITRFLAQRLMAELNAWSARVARRRADERLWAMACQDPRMMRELEMAIDQAPVARPAPRDFESLMTRRAARLLRDSFYYI